MAVGTAIGTVGMIRNINATIFGFRRNAIDRISKFGVLSKISRWREGKNV